MKQPLLPSQHRVGSDTSKVCAVTSLTSKSLPCPLLVLWYPGEGAILEGAEPLLWPPQSPMPFLLGFDG